MRPPFFSSIIMGMITKGAVQIISHVKLNTVQTPYPEEAAEINVDLAFSESIFFSSNNLSIAAYLLSLSSLNKGFMEFES